MLSRSKLFRRSTWKLLSAASADLEKLKMGWERFGGDQSMAALIAAKNDSYGPDRAEGLAAENIFIDAAARGDGWSTVPRLGERQRNDDEMRDRAPTS
jgi:hypothetical protein